MKFIIAGSRDLTQYDFFEWMMGLALQAITKDGTEISEIVSGGARGVDKMGERYATENGIPLKVFKADWDNKGKSAGYIRNGEMANYADGLIAFWDGKSKGTKHMMDTAKKKGIKTLRMEYSDEAVQFYKDRERGFIE